MNSYQKELQAMGLSKNQAEAYDVLVRNGQQTGATLTKDLGISRQLTYKVLDELLEMGLCSKENKRGSVSTFSPTHPSKLADLLDAREREITTAKKQLEAVIDNMVSDYNLEQGRPSIRSMDGLRGVEEILNDSLSAKEDIYTYVDTDSIEKHVSQINKKYVTKRKKAGIKKKILMIDSPIAREKQSLAGDLTEIRLISANNAPSFQAAMEIYDGKISYITFAKNLLTATIVYDRQVYQLHRFTFEALWDKANPS